ncbi:MAG TPA: hypothetical protein VGL37_05385 [Solirubrobacteraceae bacterium]|jgi:hypothetical protein
MDEEVLIGIREKLRRADEHLETLHDEIRSYLDSEAHTYWTDANYNAGSYSIRVAIKSPPPIRLGVICGDYIHCLRSLLDHLVCAHVNRITRRTAFPLYSDRDRFFARVLTPALKGDDGPLTGIDPESPVFAYIQSAQPYRGQHGHTAHPLRLLGELSNADKHRAILARAASHQKMDAPSLSFTGTDIAYLGAAELVYDQPLIDGAEVLRGHFRVVGPKPQVQVNGQIPVDVAFGELLLPTESLALLKNAVHEIAANITLLDGQTL